MRYEIFITDKPEVKNAEALPTLYKEQGERPDPIDGTIARYEFETPAYSEELSEEEIVIVYHLAQHATARCEEAQVDLVGLVAKGICFDNGWTSHDTCSLIRKVSDFQDKIETILRKHDGLCLDTQEERRQLAQALVAELVEITGHPV